ncbi:MAG: hypothetical protein IJK73_03010 [Bacteroidales bacterium]|nr:hypothetical protein [Bacteroidales bacterium]
MKKLLAIAVIALLGGSLSAQDYGYFNSMALGLKVGTAGLGLEAAAPVGPYVQLRAGYSMMPGLSYSRTIDVPEHPGAEGSGKGANIPVDAKATLHFQDASLLVDLFPSSTGGFHFTVGMMYGPKDAVKVTNPKSDLPNDYNTVGLDVDGYTVRATNNKIDGYIGVNAPRPYVGLGFGRAVSNKHRVGVTFDMGAIYWGKPGLFAPGEPLIGDIKDVRVTSASMNGRDEGLIELAEKIVAYPMLNLHVFVRLF